MVSNQLVNVDFPEGVDSEVQPPSGPTGEIYRYTLQSSDHTVRQLKEIQDWVIDKRLKAGQGIADVVSFSVGVKTYGVTVDANKCATFGCRPEYVVSAI